MRAKVQSTRLIARHRVANWCGVVTLSLWHDFHQEFIQTVHRNIYLEQRQCYLLSSQHHGLDSSSLLLWELTSSLIRCHSYMQAVQSRPSERNLIQYTRACVYLTFLQWSVLQDCFWLVDNNVTYKVIHKFFVVEM